MAATGTYLGGCPEELIEGSAVRPLALLFVADVTRMVAVMRGALPRPPRHPTGDSPVIAVIATAAVLLAMLAHLLLARPLTALPFIALSFVLANAESLYESFSKVYGA